MGAPSSTVGRHYRGELGERYFEYRSRGADLIAAANLERFRPFTTADDVVLDFGCGTGHLLSMLSAGRRIGIEVNPPAAAAAKTLGIDVRSALTDVESGKIDVAISSHALEHTLSPHEVLCELRRVLQKNGRLVLLLPLDDWRAAKKVKTDPNHHLYTWTPLTLTNLLLEAGFTVDSCMVITKALPPRGGHSLRRILPSWGFELICRIVAIVLRRRQLLAVGRPATPAESQAAQGC